MLIEFYPYQLRSTQGARAGALLRFEFPDLGPGYADCHPWPELGDLPLPDQLKLLRTPTSEWGSPLLARSRAMAQVDAQARAEGRNLFTGLQIPQSHELTIDLTTLRAQDLENARKRGVSTFKSKVGRNPEAELKHLQLLAPELRDQAIRLRLDFNERLDLDAACEYFLRLQRIELQEVVDFIEDPTPYDSQNWQMLRADFGFRLALDRQLSKVMNQSNAAGFDLGVLKPAIQDPTAAFDWAKRRGVPLVVTSYLDHPLGQLGAAWIAAQAPQPFERGGLISHLVYEPNDFSKQLKIASGGTLVPPPGTGLGFDSLLGAIPWSPLP